jgi:photosystem II stability/assembly factor-like uncharacterized protein
MKKIVSMFLLCYSFNSIAQNVAIDKPLLHNSVNLFEHESKFRDWLTQQPKGTKGWKWQARYEHELLKRIDGNGELPNTDNYLNTVAQVQNLQENATNFRQTAEPSWTPAGPYGDKNLFGIGRVNCIAFHPKDSAIFYLGFGQGGIWKTTNGGKSYIPLGDKLPIMRVSSIAIDPNNAETIYVSLCDFAYIGYDLYTADRKRNTPYGLGVYKSIDGGKTWNPTGLKNQISELVSSLTSTIWVNPKNSKELVVVGVKGIFKSTDGGDSWTKKLDKITSQLIQNPTNPNILFAAGMYIGTVNQGEAGIWKSEDAGNSWNLLTTGIAAKTVQRVEIAISTSNSQQIYAVSCGLDNGYEGFYRSSDGGTTWEKSPNRSNILSDAFTSRGGQGFYDLCILVNPTDPRKVYVGGLIISETADGGNTWIRSTSYSSIHPDQHFLAYNPLNQTTYLCNDGGVYSAKTIVPNVLKNVSWTFVSEGINVTSCYRLGLSEDGIKVITGAQDNASFYTTNGQNWRTEFGGDGMECALIGNYIYASYQYGYISFSLGNDNYTTVFPPDNSNETGEWTTPYLYNSQANEIIIGATNIFKIRPGQAQKSLVIVSDFKPISPSKTVTVSTAMAVPKSDSKTIYIAKKAAPLSGINSQILKTNNNGNTWIDISNGVFNSSYITYMAVDDKIPDRVWLTLSNFVDGQKVFFSNDGGQNWQNISYNLPNLPANCITYQGDKDSDILYVGMDIGVYYLVEGTTEWKLLMTNLPNVIIQELEINTTTQKLYAATFGRGIWSIDLLTGSSFVAKDFYTMNAVVLGNPVVNKSFVVKSDYNDIESVEIVDMLGRTIYQESLQSKALKFGKKLTLNDASSGIYFVKLIKGTQSKVIRIAVE